MAYFKAVKGRVHKINAGGGVTYKARGYKVVRAKGRLSKSERGVVNTMYVREPSTEYVGYKFAQRRAKEMNTEARKKVFFERLY